jgi:predicted lipoprotein with Yx(FWY)xxD motif
MRCPTPGTVGRSEKNRGTVKMSGSRMPIGGLSVAVVGGVMIASTRRSRSSAADTSSGSTAMSRASGDFPGNEGSPASPTASVQEAMARVAGAAEIILVNNEGLPLYIHTSDPANESMVAGELAAVWSPLLADESPQSDIDGVVAVVHTGNGSQVTYNGRCLYTFAADSPRHVTGHGVQNFLVATAGVAPKHAAATPGSAGAATTGTPLELRMVMRPVGDR